MGLTKQYLRYSPSGSFNIIASPGCNVVFVVLNGQEGRYLAVGASEDIIIWDMRLGEKVSNSVNITSVGKDKPFIDVSDNLIESLRIW